MPYESGIWVVFPIIILVFMLIMMTRMMGLWGRGRGGGMGRGPMGMGPMGRLDDDDDRAGRAAPPARGDDPMDVLRRRYAAGEITDEQFDAMRNRLEGG